MKANETKEVNFGKHQLKNSENGNEDRRQTV